MYKHYRNPSDTQLLSDILELYVKYVYLQSNFLYKLMEGKAGKTYIVRKQYDMFEKYGLIFRPKEQVNCENSHYAFKIHALTDRGKALAKKMGINPPIVANITRRDPDPNRGEFYVEDVETKNFWHAIGVANTLASVEIGARKHGITFISEGEIRNRFKENTGKDIKLDVSELERLEHVELAIKATGATIKSGGTKACYIPSTDTVLMPDERKFFGEDNKRTEAYYSVLWHEMGHWSGSKNRCDRDLSGRFGDEKYAMEELIAELTSAYCCAQLSISPSPREDHAQYIASWLDVLKKDKKAIFFASARAQEAVNFLL